jgi:calcineurin-like phosphoesterase family protein
MAPDDRDASCFLDACTNCGDGSRHRLREEGVRAVACHYPMETWKSAHKGYLMLHGHSHGTLRRKLPHRFDVGADVFDTPASLRNLASIAAEEMFLPTDHHGDL